MKYGQSAEESKARQNWLAACLSYTRTAPFLATSRCPAALPCYQAFQNYDGKPRIKNDPRPARRDGLDVRDDVARWRQQFTSSGEGHATGMAPVVGSADSHFRSTSEVNLLDRASARAARVARLICGVTRRYSLSRGALDGGARNGGKYPHVYIQNGLLPLTRLVA